MNDMQDYLKRNKPFTERSMSIFAGKFINGYSNKGTSIGGSSYNEIMWQMTKISECFSKPILNGDTFPEESKADFFNNNWSIPKTKLNN